jgi:hypothetical protein
MSQLTNNIKRVKNKLKVLEMEGSSQVLNEAMNARLNARKGTNDEVIKLLKAMYESELKDLESEQDSFIQGKLEI